MEDLREEIINKYIDCYLNDCGSKIDIVHTEDVKMCMDEYFKVRALELLEYMSNHKVVCGHYSSPDGFLFKYRGHELITKEQLFENFL